MIDFATPPDVATRLYEAGFWDLVSVVPPDAAISEASGLKDSMRGKVPGKRKADGTWVGYPFTRQPASQRDVGLWDEWGSNIGLLGDYYPAVDIDVDDPEIAALVKELALDVLGTAPVRYGREPRMLLPYRTETPFGRLALQFDHGGKSHTVEVLASGRQYLVAGTHPSGNPYRWAPIPLWELAPDDLVRITRQDVLAFLESLEDLLAQRGIESHQVGTGQQKAAPPQDGLKAPSIDQLRALVRRIPNDETYVDRADYLCFIYAVKAAAQDDPIEGLAIVHDWAARSTTHQNASDDVEHTYEGLNGPYRVGWPWLLDEARKHGINVGPLVFPVAPRPVVEPAELATGEGLGRALALAEGLGQNWRTTTTDLEALHEAMSILPPKERLLVRAVAIGSLQRRLGASEARQVFEATLPGVDHGAFERDGNGRPRLRVLGPDDLDLDTSFLVEDLIPEGGVGGLIADFSLGKTWLLIDLGLSVAFGRPWFGKETKQRPVVFLIAEGNHAFPQRLLGWLVEHGFLEAETTVEEMFEVLDGRVVINRYPARFDDPDFRDGLFRTVEETGAGLVFFDTLGKTLGADQSENDNDVANDITGMLSALTARTGCTAIFTHHVGLKENTRARGASAWEQGLDFAYRVSGSRADLDGGRPVTLHGRKARDFPIPEPREFRLKKLPGLVLRRGGSERSKVVSSAVAVPAVADRLLPLDARVFHYIAEQPGSPKGVICEEVTGGTDRVRAAISRLEAQGAIENRGTDTRHRWHAREGWHVDGQGDVVDLRTVFSDQTPDQETKDEKGDAA